MKIVKPSEKKIELPQWSKWMALVGWAVLVTCAVPPVVAQDKQVTIEEACSAFQQRYQAVVGSYASDLDQTDPVVRLSMLAQKMKDGDFLGNYVVSGSIEGLAGIPAHSTSTIKPVTVASNGSNYPEALNDLYKNILQLKHLQVSAFQTSTNSHGLDFRAIAGAMGSTYDDAYQKMMEAAKNPALFVPGTLLGNRQAISKWARGGTEIWGLALEKGPVQINVDYRNWTNGTGRVYVQLGGSVGNAAMSLQGLEFSDTNYHGIENCLLNQTWSSIVYNGGSDLPGRLDPSPNPPFVGYDYEGDPLGRWEYYFTNITCKVDKTVAIITPDFSNGPKECLCVDCSPASGETKVASVDLTINLGKGDYGRTAGKLYLNAERPSTSLATPLALGTDTRGLSQVIHDTNGVLRQISAPQALADVVPINDVKYEVRFYYPQQVSGTTNSVGEYEVSGSPFHIWTIENPDGTNSINRLRITEVRESNTYVSDFEWDEPDRQWTLVKGNGARRESRSSVTDPVSHDRVETYAVRNADQSPAYKEVNTFHAFPWGEEKIQQVVDPDVAALTTTWTYGEDPSNTNAYHNLQQVIQPTGYWERYEYDAGGNPTKTVAQYLDTSVSAPENQCRVTTTTHGSGDPAVTEVETVQGQEVSRRYRVYRPGETREIQCQIVGAGWDNPSNLVTVRKHLLGTEFAGEPQSVKNPDGTTAIYSYSRNGDRKTTVVKTGQPKPNSDETDIASGVRTVTVVDPAGNRISEHAYDIPSGVLLSSAVATRFDEFGKPTRVNTRMELLSR